MDEKIIEKYKKSGEIAKRSKKLAREIVKPGESYLNICSKIRDEILKSGGKSAFPVNISVNEIAAHDVATHDDKRIVSENDLVKIDIGVHVDGYIADTALSFCWNDKHKKLIEASKEGLKAAIDIIKPGVTLSAVGKAIEDAIKSYGYNSIKNLSGHEVEEYDLHSGFTVPNYDNKSNVKIEEGMALAIEPFATSGKGFIIETKASDIFAIEHVPSLRSPNSRKLFDFIFEEYQTLPFAKRWLYEKFKPFEVASGFIELRKYLKNYPNLKEETNEPVSQAEDTVLVLGSGNIKTT